MQAEETDDGKILLIMDEQEAQLLKALTGKVFRDWQGLHIIEPNEEKRSQLFSIAYRTSGALFDLV